jgi:plastocyanin
MKKIIYSILSLALALSIIVVSCGKSGGYNSMTTNPPPAAAANNTVNIVNMAFSPLTINVAAGTTVNWYNGDTMAHTVTADDASFDSGNIAVGGRYSKQFSTPGTYAYHCTIHPAMKATVVVK